MIEQTGLSVQESVIVVEKAKMKLNAAKCIILICFRELVCEIQSRQSEVNLIATNIHFIYSTNYKIIELYFQR